MYSWDLIRVFLALHRCGTFEAAANLLGVDVSTTRRKLQMLETTTGACLFVRRDGQFVLAPDRDLLLQAALQMENASHLFDRGADDNLRGGAVRVSALDIIARLIAPHVGELHRAHPNITLNLTTEPHFVNLEREMVDIAVRLARPTRGGERLKKLCTVSFGVYGSRSYLAAHPKTQPPDHKIIGLSTNFSHQDHQFEFADQHWFKTPRRIGQIVATSGSYIAKLDMCEAGLGLAMLPDYMGSASPHLERLEGEGLRMEADLWIIIRNDMSQTPKIRATVNFLTNVLTRLAPAMLIREAPPTMLRA